MTPSQSRATRFAIVLLGLFSLPICAQEPAAMTTSYKGRLIVASAEGRALENREALLKLYPGQSVQADSNASATILYFSSGKTVQVNALQRHVIQASTSKKAPPKRTRLDALKALHQPKRLPHGSRKGLGEPPVLLYPRAGKILTTTPAFAWLSSGTDSSYWIKLYRDEGASCKITGTLLWQRTLQDTLLNYPANLAALSVGQKYWIEIGRTSHEEAEGFGCFALASAQEQDAAQKQLRALRKQYRSKDPEEVTIEVIYAAYLFEQKYYAAAYATLRQALQKQPHNVTVQALAEQLYEQVGLHDLISSTPE